MGLSQLSLAHLLKTNQCSFLSIRPWRWVLASASGSAMLRKPNATAQVLLSWSKAWVIAHHANDHRKHIRCVQKWNPFPWTPWPHGQIMYIESAPEDALKSSLKWRGEPCSASSMVTRRKSPSLSEFFKPPRHQTPWHPSQIDLQFVRGELAGASSPRTKCKSFHGRRLLIFAVSCLPQAIPSATPR